jgi:hypothetical protein
MPPFAKTPLDGTSSGKRYTAYWIYAARAAVACPQCHSPMEQERHSYLVVLEVKGETEELVCSTDAGRFCHRCRAVVLDSLKIENMVRAALERRTFRYTVAGIVDLEAVPHHKRMSQLGVDDNPIPLARFRNHLPMRKASLVRLGGAR